MNVAFLSRNIASMSVKKASILTVGHIIGFITQYLTLASLFYPYLIYHT